MFVRNNHSRKRFSAPWLATAAMSLTMLPAGAQPAPPAAPTPPEPARGYRVLTLGGPVSFLGIGVQEIGAERAKELKLKEEAGVEVTRVDAESPAEKAGLKTGDAVLAYQGQRVEGAEQFVRFVRETPPGRQVKMKVLRAGAPVEITATIGERKAGLYGLSDRDRERMEQEISRARERIRALPEIRIPDVPHAVMGWRSGMLGIDGEEVEDQLAEFFGVKEGVLVRSVNREMPAAKAGLKAGDVITRIEETKVRTPREITSAIRSARNRKPLKVTLVRQKAEMTLDITLEDPKPMPEAAPRARPVNRPPDIQFE